jgi:hypothetical protein
VGWVVSKLARKTYFFKKRSKKLLLLRPVKLARARAVQRISKNEQKFFGSFFQKRTLPFF